VYQSETFQSWYKRWQNRLQKNSESIESSIDLMKSSNPAVIPRNHKVEEALVAAENNNYEVMNKLLNVLKKPYDINKDISEFQTPAPLSKEKYQTFCGT
jgi:uncharacterized protein YdiU (UPF0061 family)